MCTLRCVPSFFSSPLKAVDFAAPFQYNEGDNRMFELAHRYRVAVLLQRPSQEGQAAARNEWGAKPREWVTVKPSGMEGSVRYAECCPVLAPSPQPNRMGVYTPLSVRPNRGARLFVLYRTVKGAAIWSSRMNFG